MTSKNQDEPKLWTKHIDTRYISGEDLVTAVNGLKPEMDVYLYDAVEGETFDQKQNATEIKWVLHFKTLDGNRPLYKGSIANKGAKDAMLNALQYYKGIKSNVIQDCYNLPITMYAKQDKRHGYVVRFKPYRPSQEFKDAERAIKDAKNVKDLEAAYKGLSDKMQKNAYMIDLVKTLKEELS
jgi:hypothetical protein